MGNDDAAYIRERIDDLTEAIAGLRADIAQLTANARNSDNCIRALPCASHDKRISTLERLMLVIIVLLAIAGAFPNIWTLVR